MTHKKVALAILFWLMLSMTPSATAQVLPFFTDTALTVGFESNAIRTFSRFVVRNQLRTEGEDVPDPSDRDVFVFAEVFAVPVRINSDTVFTAVTRVLHKELNFTAPGSSRQQLSDSGLGDTTLLVKRRFYVNNFQAGGIQLALLGGVKLPTGNDNQRDNRGNLLPPSLQLGSGSVDVPVGLVFTAFKDRIGFNSAFLYQFNNESDGFRFGDETTVNLAFGYRLFPKEYKSFQDKVLNAYLEVSTVVSQRASLDDQDVLDSGGTTVFLTPGIQAVLNPRFLVEAAFQIPVVQELNGTQLAFSPTANVGIRVLF
ncbi:transporter [Acidobacteria bacterium AH-259-D05]|nr:transporter [Acidobacteria bacterium AH-259-D05]